MDLFKQGMKGPVRSAPGVPKFGVNRYSPVTDWNDDPFGAEVFEPVPQQKKKPPPRPPPPKLPSLCIQPNVPAKPPHFNRKPTVLSSLLSRRNRPSPSENYPKVQVQQNTLSDFTELNSNQLFPKCEPKNSQTGALIDLSSPPSSPTFTTRSSSDGLSVDSFGSDATTSTNNQHPTGNASQTESGFEDDFDLFSNSRNKGDVMDDVSAVDPFSPPIQKPPIARKPVVNKAYMDLLCDFKTTNAVVPYQTAPTIIRAKPARPKPPENSAILKSTFGSGLPITNMSVNTVTPIQKIGGNFGDSFEQKELNWDDDESDDREGSPPMPTIPPPPPPPEALALSKGLDTWGDLDVDEVASKLSTMEPVSGYRSNEHTPYGIALFDYSTGHPDDLSFVANARIELVRRVNDEWLVGRTADGREGLFPANYIQVKVPPRDDTARPPPAAPTPSLGTALALYNFDPIESGDLGLTEGDKVTVLRKINDEWYYGECKGMRGQFPANYVDMNVYI